MQGNYFLITKDYKKDNLDRYINDNVNRIIEEGEKPCIKVEPYKNPMSKSARDQYFAWITGHIIPYFKSRGMKVGIYEEGEDGEPILVGQKEYDKEFTHELLKKIILGEVVAGMGKQMVNVRLSIARFGKGEMCTYMNDVWKFCHDRFKLILPQGKGQYNEWLEEQNK